MKYLEGLIFNIRKFKVFPKPKNFVNSPTHQNSYSKDVDRKLN